jgi:uncharacterized coiled-coil protein SlyX
MKEMNSAQLMNEYQTKLSSQDQQLETMNKEIKRTKKLGLEMQDELKYQIKLLDTVEKDVIFLFNLKID